jgi:hypothetical protein
METRVNLVKRVKGILLSPKTEWSLIAGEPGDAGYLYRNYVLALASVPAVCVFLGNFFQLQFVNSIAYAIIAYIVPLVLVYVVALIVNALAPTFSGQKNFESALKVTAYSYTPAWVGGVFLLFPALAWLCIPAALYGLYLLYLGLPVLMKCPQDRSPVYTINIGVCVIVVGFVILLIIAGLTGI